MAENCDCMWGCELVDGVCTIKRFLNMPANQKRNDIKDISKKKTEELKRKLEEAEDAPNILDGYYFTASQSYRETGQIRAARRRKS